MTTELLDRRSDARSVVVAMVGARRHYAIPMAFAESGRLDFFYTDFYLAPHGIVAQFLRQLDRVVPSSMLRRILGRSAEGLPASQVRWRAMDALLDTLYRQVLGRRKSHADYQAWRAARFGRYVVRSGFGEAAIIYGANGASLEIFQAAKAKGIMTVLDQTSMSARSDTEMMSREQAVWPGWDSQEMASSSQDILSERESAEWKLADRIICGSGHVVDDLASQGVRRDICSVVSSGFDSQTTIYPRSRVRRGGGLNVLFVGQVGLRKGVPYLLEAILRLAGQEVHCRIVGPLAISQAALTRYSGVADFTGAIPRSRMKEQYEWADCLVLPTLSEGSAMTTYEAMAAGLPVITTPNAGSIMRDGLDGILIPAGSVDAVKDSIGKLLRDPETAVQMGESAWHRVAEFSIAKYRKRLLQVVK